MTEVKMPEPHLTGGSFLPISNMQGSSDGFTEAQLKQYGDDRAREALEMAAIKTKVQADYSGSNIRAVLNCVAEEIRVLAKEIK